MSKVSIIVPCYNCGHYIRDCLNSVIAQNYADIEIICVDDGSSDNTRSIIEDYGERVKLLKQLHRGVSAARNLGLSEATGEYIFFVDSDDTLKNNCISELVLLAGRHSADIVVIRQPEKFTESSARDYGSLDFATMTGDAAVIEMLSYNIVISAWGKLFRRDLLNDLRFNEKLNYGEGFSFTIAAMQKARQVVITNQKLYNYRVDSTTSVMSSYSDDMYEHSRAALDYIASLLPKNTLTTDAHAYASFHTDYDLLNNIVAVADAKPSDRDEIVNRLRHANIRFSSLNLSKEQRIKSIAYKTCPIMTARFINSKRKRKYREAQ